MGCNNMLKRIKELITKDKKEPSNNNLFDDEFKIQVLKAFITEFENGYIEDDGIYSLFKNNILSCDTFTALNTELYLTLKELYLIEIANPICYLLGCEINIKHLEYKDIL